MAYNGPLRRKDSTGRIKRWRQIRGREEEAKKDPRKDRRGKKRREVKEAKGKEGRRKERAKGLRGETS